MLNICVFEDKGYVNLEPLVFLRPAYDLLLGINTLLQKIVNYYPHSNITLHCRNYLKNNVKISYPNMIVNNINTATPGLFINGRVVMNDDFYNYLAKIDTNYDTLYSFKGTVVALYLKEDSLAKMKQFLELGNPDNKELFSFFREKCLCKELDNIKVLNYLWDLVNLNENVLEEDFKFLNKGGIIKGNIHPYVAMHNESNIFIDKNTVVEDFVVLNANKGPIYIEENVVIEAHTRLEGPLYIGKNSAVLGGKIKASSIGPVCKVGGEISNSVFYKHSNKAHTGFIGHSYIGEWVNLGANTTNSNLKNTYGTVTLDNGREKIDTHQLFLGTFIGDCVKTGINTVLNTGTIIGYGSSLFGAQLHPKYVAPFSFGETGKYQKQILSKFFETSERVMKRRNKYLRESEKAVIKWLYEQKVLNKNKE